MILVFAILGLVAALFVVAAVIDLKGRRRGVRYTVGARAADPKLEAARAEFKMRSDMGGGAGSGF